MPGMDEIEAEYRQKYVTGDAPWDSGVPNAELVRAIETARLPGTTALELGCGTGTNAIALARHGYRVTAVDLVDVAIARGREKACRAGVEVDFRAGDLTRMDLGGPYDVLFDSGLYHGQRTRDLAGFLAVLERVTRPGTRWLSLAGNANETDERGPPVVTEDEFREELGPLFEILDVREFRLVTNREGLRPLFWSILMRRR